MTRSLTGSASAESIKALATQPLVIIRIEWENSGTIYYADKAIVFNGNACKPVILDFSPVACQKQDESMGGFSSASVTMDDSSGELHTIYNREFFEKTICTVYHWWPNLDTVDAVTILKGKIWGETAWSEGERTLSFTIESQIKGQVIGYTTVEEDIENICEEGKNRDLPICFGRVFNVPAVKVISPPIGKLTADFAIELLGESDGTDLKIYDSWDFPQKGTDKNGNPINDDITLWVDGILFEGYFQAGEWTTVTANVPFYENVYFNARPSIGADPNRNDPRFAWIDADYNLVGKYCYVVDTSTSIEYVNFCVWQDGTKCQFARAWFPRRGKRYIETLERALDPTNFDKSSCARVDSSFKLIEARGEPSDTWDEQYYLYGQGLAVNQSQLKQFAWWEAYKYIKPDTWGLKSGAVVLLWTTDYKTTYVCNLEPSDAILDVYGMINEKDEEGKTEKCWRMIPQNYYTKQLSKDYGSGHNSTALEFDIPLEQMLGEKWTGEVFVSLDSSIGPNVCTVVRHLIETYSDLAVDEGDFHMLTGTTFARVANYPVGFALFDRQDVFEVCQDIAWQARCALFVNGNGDISMKYLSYEPTSNIQLVNEDVTKFKSLSLSFTSIDECVTHSIWKWRKNYKNRTPDNKKRRKSKNEKQEYFDQFEDAREYTYVFNTETIGTFTDTFDIFIYNLEELVVKTAVFWGYRLANIWRQISIDTFLKQIKTEIFDDINFDFEILGGNLIPGTVITINHDTSAPLISISAQLASLAGDYDMDNDPIRTGDFYLGDPNITRRKWYADGHYEDVVARPNPLDTYPFIPSGDGESSNPIHTVHEPRCDTAIVTDSKACWLLDTLITGVEGDKPK